MSEFAFLVAGRLTPQRRTHLLEADQGPRGHVLNQRGRVDGIPQGNRPHVLPPPKLVWRDDPDERRRILLATLDDWSHTVKQRCDCPRFRCRGPECRKRRTLIRGSRVKFIEYTCHHACFLIQVVDFVPYFLYFGKRETPERSGSHTSRSSESFSSKSLM